MLNTRKGNINLTIEYEKVNQPKGIKKQQKICFVYEYCFVLVILKAI